jgi:hypothetical protein
LRKKKKKQKEERQRVHDTTGFFKNLRDGALSNVIKVVSLLLTFPFFSGILPSITLQESGDTP